MRVRTRILYGESALRRRMTRLRHTCYQVYYFYRADTSFLGRATKMQNTFQPKAGGIFFTEALKQCFLRQNSHLSISRKLPSQSARA